MSTTRMDEFEALFKQFPDVPREVIVKNDLLRLGIRFTDKAILAAKRCSTGTDRGVIFSIAKVKYEELPKEHALYAPLSIWIEGGIYDLRRTIFENRLNPTTPYIIDEIDNQLTLCADGKPLAKVKYPEVPEYYAKQFEDGTYYHEVLPMNSWNLFAFNVALRYCQLWKNNGQCKFCDINAHARQKTADGELYTKRKPYKDAERVAQVAEEIFLNQGIQTREKRTLAIFITGGTILNEIDGKNEEQFYLEQVEAIRNKIGHRWPIILQTRVRSKEVCQQYRDAGVNLHSANLELWDKNLFKWICPGKELNVGRDEWVRRLIESVDVFGEGHVTTNFVSGVEMAKPFGFKTVDAALKSTTEGLEFLMSHGVIPKFDVWNISPLSDLAGNTPPPLEYYVRLDQAWCEIWTKYNLPPIDATGPMGPGRSLDFVSAHKDMDSVLCAQACQ